MSKNKKFGIRYKNCELVGFYKVEEYKDVDEAYLWVIEKNCHGVKYPESIIITSL